MAISPAEIIQRRRAELGLSHAQLAERIGRTPATVRRWESGDATPPTELLTTLANALQVEPRDLEVAFGGDEELPIEEQPTMAAPAPVPKATATIASPPQQRRRSPLQRAASVDSGEGLTYLEDQRLRLRYWLRAALTIVIVIILLVVLMWAFGELKDALVEFRNSFGDDAPTDSPGTDF